MKVINRSEFSVSYSAEGKVWVIPFDRKIYEIPDSLFSEVQGTCQIVENPKPKEEIKVEKIEENKIEDKFLPLINAETTVEFVPKLQIENQPKRKHKYVYKFTSLDGEVFVVTDLNKFCKEQCWPHTSNIMTYINLGRKRYKGWKLERWIKEES